MSDYAWKNPFAPKEVSEWPDPTPEMLNNDPLFDAIWLAIKEWDVNVPGAYGGYSGSTGNHVRAIYDVVKPQISALLTEVAALREKVKAGDEVMDTILGRARGPLKEKVEAYQALKEPHA